MDDQDCDTAHQNAHNHHIQQMGFFNTNRQDFEFDGFDSGIIVRYLDDISCQKLLQEHPLAQGLDNHHRVRTNLLAIVRTALLFQSEINTQHFYEIVGRYCGITLDKMKRAETIEQIIRTFSDARSQSASDIGLDAYHNRSTVETLFDELLSLKNSHHEFNTLQTSEHYMLAGAWQNLLNGGLAQFMDQNLSNQALVQTYHSRCINILPYAVDALLDITNNQPREAAGSISFRQTPGQFQEPASSPPSEYDEETSRAHWHDRRRRRRDSSETIREEGTSEQNELQRPLNLEDRLHLGSYDDLVSRNAELEVDIAWAINCTEDLQAEIARGEKRMQQHMAEMLQLKNDIIKARNQAINEQQRVVDVQQRVIQNLERTIHDRERLMNHHHLPFNVYPHMD